MAVFLIVLSDVSLPVADWMPKFTPGRRREGEVGFRPALEERVEMFVRN